MDENMQSCLSCAVAWDLPSLKINFALFFLGFPHSPHSEPLRSVTSPFAEKETEAW